ncbi:hypothetical protein F2Q69_00020528 [Brassica cretica]|uniref:Uncharacterized protein n=1 Tax=Brassica cretica TaxID=69181 RepID=A0A8S9QCJ9_BRACR|nr:hypothetical protein F2Q69_00020528 [Brassica cretica]
MEAEVLTTQFQSHHASIALKIPGVEHIEKGRIPTVSFLIETMKCEGAILGWRPRGKDPPSTTETRIIKSTSYRYCLRFLLVYFLFIWTSRNLLVLEKRVISANSVMEKAICGPLNGMRQMSNHPHLFVARLLLLSPPFLPNMITCNSDAAWS